MVLALDYQNLDNFEELTCSTNGFVSHYHQLKSGREPVPPTVQEYLSCFAKSINNRSSDKRLWRNKIIAELEPLFREYGIAFEAVHTNAQEKYSKDIEPEYLALLDNLKRKKSPILLKHDVNVLSHIRKLMSEETDACICLTWDGTMIGVGKNGEYMYRS